MYCTHTRILYILLYVAVVIVPFTVHLICISHKSLLLLLCNNQNNHVSLLPDYKLLTDNNEVVGLLQWRHVCGEVKETHKSSFSRLLLIPAVLAIVLRSLNFLLSSLSVSRNGGLMHVGRERQSHKLCTQEPRSINMVKVKSKVKTVRQKKGSEGVSFLMSCRGRHSPTNCLSLPVESESHSVGKSRFRSTAAKMQTAWL